MNRKAYLWVATIHLLFLLYFLLTSVFFYLALQQGNNGVTFKFLGGGDDGYFYWVEALKVADGDEATLTSIYPLLIGNLIKFTGIESPFLIRVFNFIGFILLYIISLILLKYFHKMDLLNEKTKVNEHLNSYLLLTICYFLYVSLVMNLNLSIIRDVWIYSFYLMSLTIAILLLFNHKANKIFCLALLLPSLWFLGELRGYALVSFIASITLFFVYRRFLQTRKSVILALIALLGTFGAYYTFFMDQKIFYLNKSLRDALNYRHSAFIDTHGSQMWIRLDEGNYFTFLFNYVHSYVGNMIGPLPWHIVSLNTLFIFLFESIPMMMILLFIYRNRHRLTEPLRFALLHSFMWFGFIAITNDNLGTATRLRAVGWIPILLVFAKLYADHAAERRQASQLSPTGKWK
jgi:hypothetical protein